MNSPIIHKIRNDLCTRPPNTVMSIKRKYMNNFSLPTPIPASLIMGKAARAVTIAKRAIGPNGCENSLWPKFTKRNMASIPNSADSALPKNSANKRTALKETGAKFNRKIIPK